MSHMAGTTADDTQDDSSLDALRMMAERQYAAGDYPKCSQLVQLLLQKNKVDTRALDLLAGLAAMSGDAAPLQAHLDALIQAGRLDLRALNVVLRRILLSDPDMEGLSVQAGLPRDDIAGWIAERADLERELSSVEADLLKRFIMSSVGRVLRRMFPAFEPVCAEFPGANLILLSDGTVTTCCGDCTGTNVFSSIVSKSLQEVWEQDLPSVLQRGLYELPLCRTCVGSAKAPLRAAETERQHWLEASQRPIDTVTIEMMGGCNYGCCIGANIAKYRKPNTDLKGTFAAIEDMLPSIRRLRLFNYGEPLLNKDFTWFIGRCRDVAPDVYMVTSTNAMLLDEQIAKGMVEHQLNHVVVSVHGGPGTENMLRYSKYGADYDKVLRNVARLVEMRDAAKSTYPTIGLRTILFNWNDTDECLDPVRRDAAALGLEAHWGHFSTNNYHWIHDGGGMGDRASARFRPGSEPLRQLVESREFFMPLKYEEEQSRL